MVKIYIQPYDSDMAIGIHGDNRQEILYQYYSFFNLAATDGQFVWQTDNFGFFWSTPRRFEKWLKSSTERICYNENRADYEQLLKERKSSIKSKSFLRRCKSGEYYAVNVE